MPKKNAPAAPSWWTAADAAALDVLVFELSRSYFERARGRTPLQVWTAALFNLLADAREELDDTSYVAFASIVVERVEIEAARLAVGEAVRAKRAAA